MDVFLQIGIMLIAFFCIYISSNTDGSIRSLVAAAIGVASALIGIVQNWSVSTPVVVNNAIVNVNQSSDALAFLFYIIIILEMILLILNGIVAATDLKGDDDET